MTSETYLDFCFIREQSGGFSAEIDEILKDTFAKKRLNWYLEEKTMDGAEMVIAEVKGMSDWGSEEETIRSLRTMQTQSFGSIFKGTRCSSIQ